MAKFRPFSGWIWPKVKFRAFLAKISCPKFSKCSSAIWIKFRTFYEISDNLAALYSGVKLFEGHVITRGGPHFQATCPNMRTLASDHVTKNSQFVENLTENCFQTRSLSCLVEILWSRDHLRGSAISSYVPKCADPREWSCDQKFSVWWDSTLDKPLSFLDFVFFPGPFLNFLFILS